MSSSTSPVKPSPHRVLQFSPPKGNIGSTKSPQRVKRPSPEKRCLPFTTVILSLDQAAAATKTGSPSKRPHGKAGNVQDRGDLMSNLCKKSPALEHSLAQSKRIELPYSLDQDGRAVGPPLGDFTDLLRLYPTTFAVEVTPPHLIIRVRTLPPKPWPLTIGNIMVLFTTGEYTYPHFIGNIGRGGIFLPEMDLHNVIDISEHVLREAVRLFPRLSIRIKDIFWIGACWQVTVLDATNIKECPFRIAGSPAFYKTVSAALDPDPAALRRKPPQGVEYDDTSYDREPNALLRPGIMLSSSLKTITENGVSETSFKTTTSSILVVDRYRHPFITVATRGFESDGLVFYPNPYTGSVISRIVESLLDTDISLFQLRPGLRYVNETFGTRAQPEGTRISGIAATYPPHLRTYDMTTTENPFCGSCEGVVAGVGAVIPSLGNKEFVPHTWVYLENGSEPVDGSCGSPVLDSEGKIIGLFRFKMADSDMCLCVSASELREHGYEICGGEQTFTSS